MLRSIHNSSSFETEKYLPGSVLLGGELGNMHCDIWARGRDSLNTIEKCKSEDTSQCCIQDYRHSFSSKIMVACLLIDRVNHELVLTLLARRLENETERESREFRFTVIGPLHPTHLMSRNLVSTAVWRYAMLYNVFAISDAMYRRQSHALQ